ncbi:MAG: hypothetical protein ACOC0R_02995, partial [Mariniphaga sp.]
HPAFRMPDASMIQHSIHFSFQYQMGVVSYSIDGKNAGDHWESILLIFNGNRKKITQQLPEGKYRIVVQDDRFSNEGLTEVSGAVEVEKISMMMLVKA